MARNVTAPIWEPGRGLLKGRLAVAVADDVDVDIHTTGWVGTAALAPEEGEEEDGDARRTQTPIPGDTGHHILPGPGVANETAHHHDDIDSGSGGLVRGRMTLPDGMGMVRHD